MINEAIFEINFCLLLYKFDLCSINFKIKNEFKFTVSFIKRIIFPITNFFFTFEEKVCRPPFQSFLKNLWNISKQKKSVNLNSYLFTALFQKKN